MKTQTENYEWRTGRRVGLAIALLAWFSAAY